MLFGNMVEQDAVEVLAGDEAQGVSISILIDAIDTADFAGLSIGEGEATEDLGSRLDLRQKTDLLDETKNWWAEDGTAADRGFEASGAFEDDVFDAGLGHHDGEGKSSDASSDDDGLDGVVVLFVGDCKDGEVEGNGEGGVYAGHGGM